MQRLTFHSAPPFARSVDATVAADIDYIDLARRPPAEVVAEHAYFAYLDHGRADGHDLKHWFEAEAQLIANAAGTPGRQRMP